MSAIPYEQAFKDHQYLWTTYGPASDMTGGYVDSDDLAKLLAKPTRATARDCLVTQIAYWFHVGPEEVGRNRRVLLDISRDTMVAAIADTYGVMDSYERLLGCGIVDDRLQ